MGYARYDPPSDRKSGAIVIVVPGGNYDEVAIASGEGQPIAQWLADLGITVVVLRYHLVYDGHYWPAQWEDYEACANAIRRDASSWGCDADKMGVIGFSAGGHLAGYAALMASPEIQPKLQILIYPAVDTLSPIEDGDMEPWRACQGYPPSEASLHLLAHERAPPAFLVGCASDRCAPVKENTT